MSKPKDIFTGNVGNNEIRIQLDHLQIPFESLHIYTIRRVSSTLLAIIQSAELMQMPIFDNWQK